jgi:hypothetical protein
MVPGGPRTTSPSSVVTSMNSSRSGWVSGVRRWAGVPARATSSANPAGVLMWREWVSSGPDWMVWGTCIGMRW